MSTLCAEPLHILHVIPYFSPAWAYGGPVRVAHEITRRLAARGHRITVLATDALDSRSRTPSGPVTADGVYVVRVPNLSNSLAWRRLFIPVGFRRGLRRALPGVDVVHLHEFRSLLNALALPELHRSRVPVILTPHGSLPAGLGREGLKRLYDSGVGSRLLASAAVLHAITDMEKAQFEALGLPASRMVVIPNAIDPAFEGEVDAGAFRRRLAIPDHSPVVGFLGRLNPIKGVDFLVDAFAGVVARRPDAVLVLAGPDDGARAALEAQVGRLGLRASVRFAGFLGDEASKAAAYRAADVYVLPSRYEILGISLLEALVNGTPVIATDRCGLSGQLTAANAGHVVPFGDVPSLTALLLHALDHPDESRSQAVRGRELVLAQFSWEAVTDRWEDVYRACVRSGTVG
jgi:glycosyltransferase involved in cell wall biosynthesis